MPRGWEFFLCAPYEGISYISTVLYNAGYPVRIVDVRYVLDPMGEAYRKIMEGTDVLGVATFEDNFPFVRELIDKVKNACPDMPVICGGSLITSVPHVFMKYTRVDVGVISEGELTILELMDSYVRGQWHSELKNINGIIYRAPDGQIQRTRPRGQMRNLDFLPRMRLDLWPQSKSAMGLQPQIISSYSRGCKMDCSFCYRTTPVESFKSPQKLDEELTWFRKNYNTKFIFFVDLTFNAIKDKTLGLLEVIKSHNIRWTCLTRCSNVDKEQLDAMREAGCDIALYGVESLGSSALKEARKPTTENVSIRAMNRTFDAGIRFGALTIVGLPGETEESLEHMVEWAEEYNHVTRVKYLSLMPGTTFYRQGLEKGLIKGELDHLNWLSIEQCLYEDEFINLSGLPEQVVRRAYKRLYDSYQPGPVVDFKHFPGNFNYYHPNLDNGRSRSMDYAGDGWRGRFSSAGPQMTPGSARFTLDKVGSAGIAEMGASLVACGAKKMNGNGLSLTLDSYTSAEAA
jgi:radical SAM superfamily enzyme YgiQ (UPF0313 family)